MKYKCIIIDDEAYAIEGLKNYIRLIPELELTQSYTNPLEALVNISANDAVDLILIDINMPLITGIDLSREIRKKTRKLVFTTSHSQYGYEAFEVDADAYLLKPYSFTKFAATIAKIFPRPSEFRIEPDDSFFFVKNKFDNLKMVKIRYEEIIAVESQQNYVLIHTLNRKVLTYMSLTEISKILDRYKYFVKFQRSFIISINHIDSIDGNTIRMITGLEITVGDYYRKNFTSFLSNKLIKAGR